MRRIDFMKERFMSATDIEYTNAIMDENRDMLFASEDYKKINNKMTALNDKIDQIPDEYRDMFSEYDHLFHKAYEYEICLMFFIGLDKGLSFKEKN